MNTTRSQKFILVLIGIVVLCGSASAAYGNITTLYVNTTTGGLTDYQIKFILSNASGVSGYYTGYNVIYTNGTTRADWVDINVTLSDNTTIPYWKEDASYTTSNVSVWVRLSSIASGNTTQIKWWYGDAVESTEKSNIQNTFPFGDDFNSGSSYNSTKWTQVLQSGVVSNVSNGYYNINGSALTNRNSLRGIYNMTGTATVESLIKTTTFGTKSKSGLSWRDYATAPNTNVAGFGAIGTSWDSHNEIGLYYTGWAGATAGSAIKDATDVTPGSSYRYIVKLSNRTAGNTTKSVNYGTEYTDSLAMVASKTLNPELDFEFDTGAAESNVDWLFVRNYTATEPITSVYTTSATTIGTSIVADFTQSSNPSVVGQAVTFTDTSTGTPTTWNWSIGGPAVTNTTQNAVYTFDAAGDYPVYLNVTNATGSFNVTGQTHTVINASGYTPQDVWMEGQYNITVHVTDSGNGAPLSNVSISTSDGQTATTNSFGYAFITEPFGVYVFYFTKDGYTSKSVSVAVDDDDTLDVQMTEAASTNNQQNTWYTPHQVRFRVFDGNQAPVVGAAVCATAISSTFPAGSDTSWLTNMYGIDPDITNEMLNGTLIMAGTTQSDGSTVFTMHSSIGYDLDVTNPANGVVQSVNVTPIDDYYVIHLVGSAVNNTYMQMGYNTTLNVTEPNSSFVTCNLFYQDMSASTTLVELYFIDRSNNTLLDYQSEVPVGSGWVWLNYTIPNVRGNRYSCYYNAMRTK